MDTLYKLVRVPPRGKSSTYPLSPYVEVVKIGTERNDRLTSWNLMTCLEVDELFDRCGLLPNAMRAEAKQLLRD